MIEKMKNVYVVSSLSQKEEMLDGLKALGIMHLAEKKGASREVSDYCQSLAKTVSALSEYMPGKKEKKALKGQPAKPVLRGEDFTKLYEDTTGALEQITSLTQRNSANRAEIDRISPWGDFVPEELKALKEQGYDLHFYHLGKNEYKLVMEDENIKAIKLASVEKQATVAVIGTLPSEIAATEFTLPEKGVRQLEAEIEANEKQIADCKESLRDSALYLESFNAEMLRAKDVETYSSASHTADNDENFVWLTGYIPEEELDNFKAAASKNAWAWAIDDVEEDDDKIPTKLKFGKVSGLIKPVFDILGILPGYRETDISLWFFLFFTLFFAMIVGDGGYGMLILVATIAFVAKTKKQNTATYLLFVLSIATIIWGAVTGTWFGMESAMKVPFLKAMVIPSFANYPEYFGVTATEQQNMIMKFSFSIGAIQMALGSLIAIKKKIAEKNLSWLADLGWMIAVIAMYLLSLYLVIGENVPIVPVFVAIGIAFAMVLLFGAMEPGLPIGKGIKAGLANAFTVFLDTISCFGNVMSYIRLFAVGMAGLAISQSFNGIAADMTGPLVVVAVVVVLIGHALNIVMCFLSVVVHGVRLNVLEFSGQVGLEWTGIAYEPFAETQAAQGATASE